MSIPIIWSAEAVDDLAEIHDFIARRSPRYASIVTARLVAAVDRVGDFPDSGRKVPELDDPGVREIIYREYRIVYERRADAVEILTVFRASRRFPPLG